MIELAEARAAGLACMLASCSGETAIQVLPGDGMGDAGCDACTMPARGLSFSGPYDRVEVPSSPLLDVPQDFAVEAWVLVESYAGGHGIFNRWTSEIADIELTFGAPELVSDAELPVQPPVPSHMLATWAFVHAGRWISAYTTTLPEPGVWHHVASSYGGGAMKLYVDGVRTATASGTERIPNPDSKVYIGATARSEHPIDPTRGEAWWPPMQGFVAEVRVSSVDRYAADFVPERRLSTDASTIALWHLDEGSGTTAVDDGPNRLDGTIVNAKWTTVPAR